jgi:hypothetical protein
MYQWSQNTQQSYHIETFDSHFKIQNEYHQIGVINNVLRQPPQSIEGPEWSMNRDTLSHEQ